MVTHASKGTSRTQSPLLIFFVSWRWSWPSSVATRAALGVVTSSRNLCRACTGLCAAVVVSAWLDTASSDNEMACSHIFGGSSGLQANLELTSRLHARPTPRHRRDALPGSLA